MTEPTSTSDVLRLMLVEDLDDDAFFFQLALEKACVSATVTQFDNGIKALDYLRANAPQRPPVDVIFLDLKLPGIDGFDILKWIGQQNFIPPLRVVVMSGSSQQVDISQARELGVREYIVKPVQSESLKTLLAGGSAETHTALFQRAESLVLEP
jgi:CheY-like chemotaxis protein